ncbi:MAG TPA: DNA-formamidopyrimidine glycosylase family protein [Actinomycetota bacterium]|nr:DNA-formamidopyrimidine glycosylase family protein [Actinomycetota bacterium]
MPEGDTVHLAARRLNATLAENVLTRTDFRVPAIATTDLGGRVLREVVPRGKHLLFRIDGGVTLHTHFKMEGSWHLYRHGEPWRGPADQVRAVLETEDWAAVGFRLAICELIPTERESDVVGHLGPDVLGPDWDAGEVLTRLLARGDDRIGDVIADQTVMAGPGNIYRCEACFLRGVHPDTLVRAVPDPARLVGLMKRLMEANRDTGMQVTTGDRRPGHTQWVYGRRAEPCRRCGTPIATREDRFRNSTRVTYWCPRCQPIGP